MNTFKKLCATALLSLTLCAPALAAPQDKTVNMALFWLDGDLEPTSAWHGWTLARTGIGENLVQIDENLKFKPVIAESWKQLDEMTTQFTIRDGITFQNGKKVDAKAVKESLERMAKRTDRKEMLIPIDSISADGNTLTIKTSRPFPTLLNLLADPVYTVVDAEAAAKDPEGFKFKPISTGAFMVESFTPGTGFTLKKYAGYWKGEPKVDAINVKYLQNANTRAMALQSGELDFVSQIDPGDLDVLRKDPKLEVVTGANLRIFFLRSNIAHPWMQSLDFRKAVRMAIHKDIYAEKIAGAIPARGPFTDMLPFAVSGNDAYSYNPEEAKKLLDAAGIKDTDGDGIREWKGKDIVLQYVCMTNHGARARNIGVAMQADLKKVGLGMEIKQLENFNETARRGQYDFIFERWTSAPTLDPQYFLDASFKTGAKANTGKYSNAEFDALLEQLSKATDTEKRNELGRKGTRMLMDDAASIFLFYEKGNIAYNKRLTGIHKFASEIYYIDDRIRFADEK